MLHRINFTFRVRREQNVIAQRFPYTNIFVRLSLQRIDTILDWFTITAYLRRLIFAHEIKQICYALVKSSRFIH